MEELRADTPGFESRHTSEEGFIDFATKLGLLERSEAGTMFHKYGWWLVRNGILDAPP